MGDRIGVQLPVREIYLSLTNHPGQLSLASFPSRLAMFPTSLILANLTLTISNIYTVTRKSGSTFVIITLKNLDPFM